MTALPPFLHNPRHPVSKLDSLNSYVFSSQAASNHAAGRAVHKYNDNLGVEGLLREYETVHNITGLPILHGEFSFTAIDSGVPNLKGARSCPNPPHCQPNHPFVLQKERAEQAKMQVETIANIPYLVGYHWWRWVDETPGGRWPRGENSNYGLVRVDHQPYVELTATFTSANAGATVAHAQLKVDKHDWM